MENNQMHINESEFCDAIVDHLRNLNRELVECYQGIQASLERMDYIDNEQMRLTKPLWHRSFN